MPDSDHNTNRQTRRRSATQEPHGPPVTPPDGAGGAGALPARLTDDEIKRLMSAASAGSAPTPWPLVVLASKAIHPVSGCDEDVRKAARAVLRRR